MESQDENVVFSSKQMASQMLRDASLAPEKKSQALSGGVLAFISVVQNVPSSVRTSRPNIYLFLSPPQRMYIKPRSSPDKNRKPLRKLAH